MAMVMRRFLVVQKKNKSSSFIKLSLDSLRTCSDLSSKDYRFRYKIDSFDLFSDPTGCQKNQKKNKNQTNMAPLISQRLTFTF